MKNKNYRLFEDGVWEKAFKEAKDLPILNEKEQPIGFFKELPEILEGTTLELNMQILEEQDGVVTKCQIDSISLVKNSELDSNDCEYELINLSKDKKRQF